MENINTSAWSELISKIRQKTEESIFMLGIPIIKGDVTGHGCCFIKVEEFDFSTFKNIITIGSICVINTDEASEEESAQANLQSFKVYVRLGYTSTWLYYGIQAPEPEDDEEFLFEEDDENDLDKEQLVDLSLQIAQTSGFGILKNKSQRLEFTQSQLPTMYSDEVSEYSAREIASRAENYFELGVLPLRAKSLQDKGKSVAEIAKALGISKPRAERAINAEVPTYILEKINKSNITSETTG